MTSESFTQKIIIKIFCTIYLLAAILIFNSCGKDKTETKNNSSDKGSDTKTNTLTSSDFIVDYELIGKMAGNMEILRKGDKIKQIINSEIMGMQNANTIYVSDNGVYSITEINGKKFGMKSSLDEYNSQKNTGETITDFKEFEKFIADKKVTGNENILGYNCDIYDTGNGMLISVYNKRYILRMKSPEFMATATKINDKPEFKANEFDIPSDVEFKTMNSSGINKNAVDSLANKIRKK